MRTHANTERGGVDGWIGGATPELCHEGGGWQLTGSAQLRQLLQLRAVATAEAVLVLREESQR